MKAIFRPYDTIYHNGVEYICIAINKDYVAVFAKMKKVYIDGDVLTKVCFNKLMAVDNGNNPDTEFKYERSEEWVI